MTSFSARNTSQAEIEATPERMWEVLTDHDLLARLTPLVSSISADGDRWCWHLSGISALGLTVAPAFTVAMRFDEPRRIDFDPVPSDESCAAADDTPSGVTASAQGVYVLEPLSDGRRTRLLIDLELSVDLPLPRLTRRAVEKVMAQTMAATGKRFAANLSKQTGIQSTPPRDADPSDLERPASARR